MQLSTFISYTILAGTGIFCVSHFKSTAVLPVLSFEFIIVYSFAGMLKYIQDSEEVDAITRFARSLMVFFAYPCFVGHLWNAYLPGQDIGTLHPLSSVAPFVLYNVYAQDIRALPNLIVALNSLSCFYISLLNDNWYGLSACIVYVLGHASPKRLNAEDVPEEDNYNFWCCLYAVLSLAAIIESYFIRVTIYPV